MTSINSPAPSAHARRRPSRRELLAPARASVEGLTLLTAIVVLMWALEGINYLTRRHDGLDADGIYPRNVDRLWGILTAPFLHVSFQHLIDNTVPFVFMGVIIALRGALRLALVTSVVIVVGGVGTWLIAPGGTVTVGASGVVFGYATYLFTRGLFDRSVLDILTGVVVGVVWGGALVSSIVPHNGVSWQAHACGAVGGVVAAWLLGGRRNQRPTAGSGPRGGNLARHGHDSGHRSLHESLDRALAQ